MDISVPLKFLIVSIGERIFPNDAEEAGRRGPASSRVTASGNGKMQSGQRGHAFIASN
jgi:acyl-CoA synthetase (AMP-forming)/AMP-acid ligase II